MGLLSRLRRSLGWPTREEPRGPRQNSADPELQELRQFAYTEARIPRHDALEIFVPTGSENDTAFAEATNRPSRWFPVSGGHRVLILHDGGPFDASRFTLVKAGWDHEHCKRCHATIEPMTRCWVTENSPFIILCADCHRIVVDAPP